MWFRITLWLALLSAQLGSAAALPANLTNYDAIVVGGGPAGLSAASGLARVRRNVLLVDSGEYRNGPTRKMHDVIGFDGVTPAYFRYAARKLILFYPTVSLVNGTVINIAAQNTTSSNTTLFSVTVDFLEGGLKTVQTRKIVLATGMRDILPSTPGVSEEWGKGIYWCPWCDGYETANQTMGMLAPLEDVPTSLREVLTLNKDIIALVNGTDTPDHRAKAEAKVPGWEAYLKANNVTVDNRTITRITRLAGGNETNDPFQPSVAHHDLFSVEFQNGSTIRRNVFFASFATEQASNVGTDAGVKLDGQKLGVNEAGGMITSIPGVYAVGDANSDNSTNVPHAMYSGKRAAVYLHVAIAREDGTKQIEAASGSVTKKRGTSLDPRDVWNRMNGEPGDILYAGNFDKV